MQFTLFFAILLILKVDVSVWWLCATVAEDIVSHIFSQSDKQLFILNAISMYDEYKEFLKKQRGE